MTGWERLGIGGLSQGFLLGSAEPLGGADDALAGIAAIDDDLSAFVAIDADGFQLRLGWKGKPTWPTANRASCVGVSPPTTSAPTPPTHDFGYVRIRSLVLPGTDNSYSA